MRFWYAPSYFFNYSFPNVVAVFYERYPNTHAKHILSEDVLSREITDDQIVTRKLIVKKSATFLNSIPKWMSRLASVQYVPTIEESIFDRRKNTLVSYTRNIAWRTTLKLDEKCTYMPSADGSRTELHRALSVFVDYGRLSSFIERVVLGAFKNSIKKSVAGFNEKLQERCGRFQSPANQTPDRPPPLKTNFVQNGGLKWDKA
ncbi:PRELI domain-containing protein 1, mitochondrial [Aphelenchoides fujianensis]|nr:PRELI domain-containing protein 1, mitochondrial [Aphelenchoides fujianensis]